jgi:hypothetical protein
MKNLLPKNQMLICYVLCVVQHGFLYLILTSG